MPATNPDRAHLAQQAAVEVESIAAILQLHFQRTEVENAFVVGLGIRLEILAGIVLSALYEDEACAREAVNLLAGPAAVRARREQEQ